MAFRDAENAMHVPHTLTDAIDAELTVDGAMVALQNLIPDPTGKGIYQCRPAALKLTSFAGFTTPGAISCCYVVGSVAYGLIATGRFAGQEEPFAYNITTGLFVTITGPTAVNTPVAAPTSGAWTPPTIAQVGAKLIFAHSGFKIASSMFFGVLDISNPAAPVWSSGTSTGAIIFSARPTSVAQFNGRCWYVIGNTIYFSDTTSPINFTSATQSVTVGLNVTITALAGLPLTSATQGGIIQALIAFAGTATMYQITGDAATSNLALNQLNVVTGTYSQTSVTPAPNGLWFISPDGLRFIDTMAHVSDPIDMGGNGVIAPFLYSLVPTRICMAYAGDTIRISTQNGLVAGSPNQEYWYHLSRKSWTGPHTFPASVIQQYGGSFIMAPAGVTGSLWQSDAIPGLTTTYTENAVPLTWLWQTPLLNDKGWVSEMMLCEASIYMKMNGTDQYLFNYLDESSTSLGSMTLQGSGSPTVWGAFTWGAAPWLGTVQSWRAQQLAHPAPIIFKRMALQCSGPSSSPFRIGRWEARLQRLGYIQQ